MPLEQLFFSDAEFQHSLDLQASEHLRIAHAFLKVSDSPYSKKTLASNSTHLVLLVIEILHRYIYIYIYICNYTTRVSLL